MHDPRLLLVDVLVEGLPAEHHFAALEVERRVEGHARDPGFQLAGGGGSDDGVGLAVEETDFVGRAVEGPGVEFGVGVVGGEGEGGEGDGRGGFGHFEWISIRRAEIMNIASSLTASSRENGV